jgi:hypothetical protein
LFEPFDLQTQQSKTKKNKKLLTRKTEYGTITMWKADSNIFLEYLAREQVTTKKLKKVIDKLSTICYNNNVNKNKFKERNEVFSMEKKMTKKEMFALIREEVKGNAEMVAFIDHELELLEKKRGSADSKKSEEHKVVMDLIRETLALADKGLTVTELQKASVGLGALSNQKVSSMLKKMVDNGEVVKTIEKKVSYFSLA